ncbi:DoxX family protein [Streptomyces triticagri]|uniref:DoxX family protein n=1 Tax=Streptomyces triticagri TaxID=2293568 RepID=UPI0018F54D1F|nr:DoxX family protein [Streptomyces triticagri]
MSEATLPTTTGAGTAAPARTASEGPARSRSATIGLRVLATVLGVFYAVASGAPKLAAHSSATESFDRIGWGDGFMYTIGALEVLGGIALLIPLLSGVAALAFIGLMIGATVMSLVYFDAEFWFTPVILVVPLIVIARTQRHRTLQLVRLLSRRS